MRVCKASAASCAQTEERRLQHAGRGCSRFPSDELLLPRTAASPEAESTEAKDDDEVEEDDEGVDEDPFATMPRRINESPR